MKKVLLVFGTRPEAIKMCPLALKCRQSPTLDARVCVTAQHRQMLDSVLDAFGVTPDIDLDLMRSGQDLYDITIRVLQEMKKVIDSEKPDIVLVHGDTSTSFAAALAAFYSQVPVGHVEAGLRTYNISSPFPEEFNRQAVDSVTSFYFAPTAASHDNLLREKKDPSRIWVTGNTGIDALAYTIRENYTHPELDWAADSRLLLITAHRRENLGEPMRHMFRAIRRLTETIDNIKVIYPVHMNPKVQEIAGEILSGNDLIHLIEPLNVLDFHNFMAKSYIILTDSGGIQEEAPSLGKPVLVMRDTTERPEGIESGTLKLVGTDEQTIYDACRHLLTDSAAYGQMSHASNPYGDGKASERIVQILTSNL